MATLTKRMRGGSLMFEIRFYVNGERTTIPLGAKYNEQTATDMLRVVKVLVHNKINSIPILDKRSHLWIDTATQEIRDKLGKAGLIEVSPVAYGQGALGFLPKAKDRHQGINGTGL